jgi:hypothetical protein
MFLNVFKKKHKHSFLIVNAFYTLKDMEQIDLIKECQDCKEKECLSMNRGLLLEVLEKYPNAFSNLLRSYLLTWKI